MKKESNALYILRLALTLLLITAVVAAALAGVNAVTKDKIAAIKAEKTLKAISAVLPDGGTAQQVDFAGADATGTVKAVYATETGYAVEVTPVGFGGEIDMMVGVSRDGTVLGVSIISHSETASLGAVAAENSAKGQSFRDSFIGLSGNVTVSKDGGQADTLTGATITSRAVAVGVSTAVACAGNLG